MRYCAPRDSLRSIAAIDGRLGAVDHEAELDRAEHVLVEDGAAVVDPRVVGLLAQAADRLERERQALLVAEDGGVFVHQFAELALDLRDAPALAGAGDDRVDARGVLAELGSPSPELGIDIDGRAVGGVFAGAAAEDQRVEQRVGAEAVAAVDRDAGDLARGVEALDRRAAVDVGLHAAHDVVLAGADHDRFAGDVHAGEVAAEVDDLAQRLERALARDDRDVEVDAGAVGADAAALVDLDLLGARDDVAGGELHLVRGRFLHEAFAVGVQQVGALAARALGDQHPGLDQAGGVVLDHLHVHQRRADAVGQRDAVAGDDQAVGGRLVCLARRRRRRGSRSWRVKTSMRPLRTSRATTPLQRPVLVGDAARW